ncbi:MAG: class I SAM-dependent methyltransferase [Candidatus Lokiarchaeota archaeon]|nr:class I SAM-dependent methyltransferase [Candidatus Lokiarchaeota archaeon]
MSTLEYIVKKFDIDLNKKSPFYVSFGRFRDIPKMFTELNFKKGAEIGVFEGSYTKVLLERIPELALIGVDLWEPYKGYKDFKSNTIIEAYNKALKNVKGYNCQLIKGRSNEVVKNIPDESLDFVFIDGNHAYEYVVEDIALWSKKVRKGGIIYGHDFDDYSNSRRYNEMNVINAVTGWCNSYKIHPWIVITNNKNKCWLYVKD